MKHMFVDTNVLIDFFANRKPFALEAAKLFNDALNKKVNLFISAVSYNNMYYILRQSCSHAETIKMLTELTEWVNVLDVTKEVINKALKSNFKDFEDAIQYFSAKTLNKIDLIVTRDEKGFKSSTLPVLTPKEALILIEGNAKLPRP